MIVSGSAILAAGRPALWARLRDPSLLAEALPDVEDVDVLDAHHFSATANPVTALGRTRVVMDFEIVEEHPEELVRINASGRAGENQLGMSVALRLADDDAGTAADWTADLHVRGVLSSLLQRGLGALFDAHVRAVLDAAATP